MLDDTSDKKQNNIISMSTANLTYYNACLRIWHACFANLSSSIICQNCSSFDASTIKLNCIRPLINFNSALCVRFGRIYIRRILKVYFYDLGFELILSYDFLGCPKRQIYFMWVNDQITFRIRFTFQICDIAVVKISNYAVITLQLFLLPLSFYIK